MENSVAIVYFSGTGNTKAVTGFLADELEKHLIVEIFKVEDILMGKSDFDIEKYQIIGLGYPIYGFNAPPIIFDFIKCLNSASNKKAFIYSTCAGPFYFNDIASFRVKRQLNEKGIRVFYERQFYMPANILTMYNDDVSKQLCNAVIHKTRRMAEEIIQGITRVRKDRIGPRLMGWLYAAEKKSWKLIPKDFIVLDTCTKCNKCAKACPMGNINIVNNEISFGLNCTACYRCAYQCPNGAITGKKYGFAIFKEGYDIDKIINNDELSGSYITPKTWGYYGVFKRYLFKETD